MTIGSDSDVVETLDGCEVTETTRQFLLSWQANKDAIKQRLENRSATSVNGRHATSGGNVARNECSQKSDDLPCLLSCLCQSGR